MPRSSASLAARPYIHTEHLEDTTVQLNSGTLYSSLSPSTSSSPYMTSKESFEDTRLHTEYVPDQDCAREDWVQGNPSGLARAWQFLRKNTTTRCYYVVGFIVVVLLVSITSTSTPVVEHVSSSIKDIDVAAFADKLTSLGKSKSTCDDPFAMPGYIWYGKNTEDVRWAPYKYLDVSQIADPKNIELHDPEKESKLGKTALNTPPDTDRLPLEFSKLFKTPESRQENVDALDFMRNKHIMTFGSSLDREMTKMFCKDHQHGAEHNNGGKYYAYTHARHTYCHFEDYNFTISTAQHFGLHQTDWFHGEDAEMGLTIEQRLDGVVKPLANKFGKPDLFVFSSGLWDLMFFNKIERRKDANCPESWFPPVSYDKLMWHRSRLAEVIGTLRETFPSTALMYRTTTQPGDRRSDKDDEMIAVFQVNQSARTVMKLLKVPLLHWSELIKGSHSYRDFLHYETDSRQNWLYGEMLLYTLRQVSDPTADTSCWLDR